MGDQSELEEIQKRHDASAPFRLPCDTAQLAATSYNQCREDRAKLLSYISAARGKQRTPGTYESCVRCERGPNANDWRECTKDACPIRIGRCAGAPPVGGERGRRT